MNRRFASLTRSPVDFKCTSPRLNILRSKLPSAYSLETRILSTSIVSGTVTPADVVGLTGLSATSSVNSFASVSTNATITLSGLSLTASAGLLTEDDHSVGLSGLSATSAVGSLAPADVMGLSGLSVTSSVGSLTILM